MLVRAQHLKVFVVYSCADHAPQSSNPQTTVTATGGQDHSWTPNQTVGEQRRVPWGWPVLPLALTSGRRLNAERSRLRANRHPGTLGSASTFSKKYTTKQPETPELGRQLVIGTGIL